MVNFSRDDIAKAQNNFYSEQKVEWIISDSPIPYEDAVAAMERRAALIAAGDAPECVWLLEHPPLYTAGSSADVADLIAPNRFPVHETRRGGQYTYHGPGQRVGYVMLNLNNRQRDVRGFVSTLEEWIIATLNAFNIRGERREDRVGVWVKRPEKGISSEDKIAALGIKIRKWVSYHGISINLDPDLEHFTGIVPCGINQHGVTSFHDLGQLASMNDLDLELRNSFEKLFGTTTKIDIPQGENGVQSVSRALKP